MQQGKTDYRFVSLSFNSYSTDGLAAIAASVTNEFNDEQIFNNNTDHDLLVVDDFEFSNLMFDEFSSNPEIQSIFPVFNCEAAGDDHHVITKNDVIGIPLKELFMYDREEHSSSTTSSSEFDELELEAEPIPEKTYCLWRPKLVDSSHSRTKWKKSRSAGQGSKRWKLLDLLRRSNSEGFPKHIEEKPAGVRGKIDNDSPKKDESVRKVINGASLHEVFYLRNRAEKEGGKRKSYLPYRQNIVGFFASVNPRPLGKSFSF